MNINFVDTDSGKILNDLIKQFETALGQTFYPGDERRIFLQQLAQVIVGLKNDINQSARQNLLRYASGDKLDAIGELYNTPRILAQKAKATIRFTLSSAQTNNIIIPAGTRVTPDGQLYFATIKALVIPAGQTYGDVVAEAAEGGEKYNGFAPGQIKTIVDPVPYVASAANTDTSAGGSDNEDDDNYRERIRLAPESFSVAGPEGAYIYWAKTADVNIADVSVSSPSPGEVQIAVLMKGGQIPTQDIIDAVTAVVSAKDKRPLTDNVQVCAPTEVSYDIDLTYYISADRQAEENALKDAIEAAIEQYNAWQSEKLGRDVNPDYLRQLMLNAGAYKIDLIAPTYAEIGQNEVAKVRTISVSYGGLI